MDSSMGKMCLGKDVIEISSDRNEGSGDWDSPEYKDTTGSGGKKEPEALVFHKMDTEEDSDRYIAQCFVNGLYASDGEINLEKNDNLISNDYAVKLCLEYEVRKGKKLVQKELMVLLRGEIYFVQFIINPEEDEFEPRLIFRRSFLRSANAIVNFGEGTITIQPDFDPFLLSSDEEGKPNLDDLETLLDFDEVPQIETDLPPMVCKMGKGSRNKKKVMENIMYFNNGAEPSSSFGIPLTQEETKKRALAHNISMRYEILEEVRPVIETLGYNDKYRKLLDEIWAEKVKLDGMIKSKEEKAMSKMKGHMLKEKKDPGAFIFPIRLEGQINENALADTGSDTNTMPYRIYEQLGRDDMMKEDRNITMINYTEAEVTGQLVNVLCQVGFTTLSAKFLILEILVDQDAPIVVGHGFLNTIGGNIDIPNSIFTTFDGCNRQTFRAAKSEKIKITESDSDDEEDYMIKRNIMGIPIHNSRPIGYQNNINPAENMTLSTLELVINPFRKISVWKKVVSFQGSLPAKVRDVEWKPDYKLCYSNPKLATRHWKTEIRLTDPYENIYMQAFVTKPTKRILSQYHKLSDIMSPNLFVELQVHTIMRPGHPMPNALEMLKPSKKHYSQMFTMNSWNGEVAVEKQSLVITLELCRKFYATYKFDEVCADDELQSKKIISFKLRRRAYNLTLLEFARRLGLYHAEELEEEIFDTYFQGGLRSDENFNAKEYWERISIDKDLHSSRSSITSVRFSILRVLHKMITYRLCQRTTGYEKIQRNDLWLLSMFNDRHQNGYANVAWVIEKWMKRKGARSQKDSQICYDRTTLRELIDSKDRLILEILIDDVPRVAAQRALRV
ncbi:ribonuclease H-like domain-containing protein [Tanacetum coccineum]